MNLREASIWSDSGGKAKQVPPYDQILDTAMVAVFRFRVGMFKVIAACSAAGLLYGQIA